MAPVPSLILNNNSAQNPITLELGTYVNVQDGEGMDPYDPSFSERVFSHSLLKEGGTLALEDLKLKELAYPLRLKSVNQSAIATLVQQINQVLGTAGMTVQWQDAGMTQYTYFDGVSGQFDIAYRYREQEHFLLSGKLRLFVQPFGRTQGPRTYATASGYGPLLMISPYASGGAQTIAASTQGGVAGYGGAPGGASTGVFYTGAPSLAGDAPAMLQISYVGPLPNGASNAGVTPNVAVSLLPDKYYQPLITAPDLQAFQLGGGGGIVPSHLTSTNAVAGQYWSFDGPLRGVSGTLAFSAIHGGSGGVDPAQAWAGNHRVFAIARASGGRGVLYSAVSPLVGVQTSATVNPGDWALYDLGVFSLRPSETPAQLVTIVASPNGGGNLDVTALAMLPDSTTHFLNPANMALPQLVSPGLIVPVVQTNTLLYDDTLGDQFIYTGASQTSAPSPLGSVPSSARITQYTRGLVPRPDPKNGLPIIAVLGVGQMFTASSVTNAGGSWTNQPNLRTMAQVNVLERTRYVLP